jgi:hypothetical protein
MKACFQPVPAQLAAAACSCRLGWLAVALSCCVQLSCTSLHCIVCATLTHPWHAASADQHNANFALIESKTRSQVMQHIMHTSGSTQPCTTSIHHTNMTWNSTHSTRTAQHNMQTRLKDAQHRPHLLNKAQLPTHSSLNLSAQ